MILSLFVDVKSIQFNQSIQFKKNEKKPTDGAAVQKYQKEILKQFTLPQRCQGCQTIWMTKLKTTLESWSVKIEPKLNKI